MDKSEKDLIQCSLNQAEQRGDALFSIRGTSLESLGGEALLNDGQKKLLAAEGDKFVARVPTAEIAKLLGGAANVETPAAPTTEAEG